mgnify:CR=1 FL=1
MSRSLLLFTVSVALAVVAAGPALCESADAIYLESLWPTHQRLGGTSGMLSGAADGPAVVLHPQDRTHAADTGWDHFRP